MSVEAAPGRGVHRVGYSVMATSMAFIFIAVAAFTWVRDGRDAKALERELRSRGVEVVEIVSTSPDVAQIATPDGTVQQVERLGSTFVVNDARGQVTLERYLRSHD